MNLIDRDSLLEKIQFRIEPQGVVGATVRDMVEKTREIILDEPVVKDINVPSWIPVTERLPDNTEKVLALSKSSFGSNYLSWLIRYNPEKGAFYDYDSEWGDIKIHNVTHWMPLPEPPKEVE